MNRQEFYDAVDAEVARARSKFPNPDHLTLALAEEAGEVTKAVLDYRFRNGKTADIKKELIQTMAMCVRLFEEGDPTLELHFPLALLED